MKDCVFCKIAAGEIPSTKVYEDDTVLAFNDLDPQAPTHVLIIPKEHIESAAGITPDLVRFSCGIEDGDDLIADMEQALNQV